MTIVFPLGDIRRPTHLLNLLAELDAVATAAQLRGGNQGEIGYRATTHSYTTRLHYEWSPAAWETATVTVEVEVVCAAHFESWCSVAQLGQSSADNEIKSADTPEMLFLLTYERDSQSSWQLDDIASIGRAYVALVTAFPIADALTEWSLTIPIYSEPTSCGIDVVRAQIQQAIPFTKLSDPRRRQKQVMSFVDTMAAVLQWLAPDRTLPSMRNQHVTDPGPSAKTVTGSTIGYA